MSKGPTGAKGRLNRVEMSLGRPAWPIPKAFGPPFLECEDDATLRTCGRRHSQGENHSPERSSTN
jgi:hypothetical protein